jgi:hypothetical protein
MNRITSILTGLSLAVVFFVASAHAQFDEPRTVANIPFEFTVGTLSLPAGQYQFQRTPSGFIAVRDTSGHTMFTLPTASFQDNSMPGKSLLRFVTLQGRHVLVQVWDNQAASGYEFRAGGTSVDLANSDDSPER